MSALMKKPKKARVKNAFALPFGTQRWALIVAVMAVLGAGAALIAARQPANASAHSAPSGKMLSDVPLESGGRPHLTRAVRTGVAGDTAASASNAAAGKVAAVTLTGCLVRDDDTFWLKDASGANVPTSRSWKSGFLKKKSPRIELVDANKALKLPTYVGQRVEATGTLADGAMKSRALQRVAASCN
jgi:hypothetical protein